MADLKAIEFPNHLNEHNLTEQELVNLNASQQALAKDWNVINRKMDWMMNEMVTLHNVIVQHDQAIDLWKKVVWAVGLLSALASFIFVVMRIVGQHQ